MTGPGWPADQPLEERPEVAAAVEDETTVPQLAGQGGPDRNNPSFRPPGAPDGDFPPTGDLIGAAMGGGTAGADPGRRTGAEQPWDPEDLAVARGKDPTPDNVEQARRDLDRAGPTAVEKTVP